MPSVTFSRNMNIWNGIRNVLEREWIKWKGIESEKQEKYTFISLLLIQYNTIRTGNFIQAHKISEFAQKAFGWRAKMFNQKRFKEKAALRKTLSLHQEGSNKHANDDKVTDGTVVYNSFS